MKKRMMIAAFAATIGLVASACGGSSEKLYLFNWIYYIPDDVIEDFTEETGIKVIVDSYASNEEMYNKIVAGGVITSYSIHYTKLYDASEAVEFDVDEAVAGARQLPRLGLEDGLATLPELVRSAAPPGRGLRGAELDQRRPGLV